jgi:hypothetical protein
MPKKKTVETVDELKLDFTGKMTIVMELAGFGPMEYRIDDKDVCLKIIRLLLKEMGPTMTVDSYNKRTENTLRRMLDF